MVVALSLKEKKADVVNQAVRELQQGRDNACGQVTLMISVATTTVPAPTCAPNSHVFLMPLTKDASTEWASTNIYISAKNYGSFVITHSNNAVADRTFDWTVRGGNLATI